MSRLLEAIKLVGRFLEFIPRVILSFIIFSVLIWLYIILSIPEKRRKEKE